MNHPSCKCIKRALIPPDVRGIMGRSCFRASLRLSPDAPRLPHKAQEKLTHSHTHTHSHSLALTLAAAAGGDVPRTNPGTGFPSGPRIPCRAPGTVKKERRGVTSSKSGAPTSKEPGQPGHCLLDGPLAKVTPHFLVLRFSKGTNKKGEKKCRRTLSAHSSSASWRIPSQRLGTSAFTEPGLGRAVVALVVPSPHRAGQRALVK